MMRALYGLTAALLLLPLLAVLYLSVVTQWSYPQLLEATFTGQYWIDLLQGESNLLRSLGLSLLIASLISVSALLFGFTISGQLTATPRRAKWLPLAFYPYLIAPVVLGAMLQFYFVRFQLSGSLGGVMLAQVLFIFPYAVLFMSTFWNDRVRQTAYQALTLGATQRQLYQTVLIPMAKPWLFICWAQCFLISWFEYGITRLVGVGKVVTLSVVLMQYVEEANPHLAALAACLMILPVLLLLLLNQRIFLKSAKLS